MAGALCQWAGIPGGGRGRGLHQWAWYYLEVGMAGVLYWGILIVVLDQIKTAIFDTEGIPDLVQYHISLT